MKNKTIFDHIKHITEVQSKDYLSTLNEQEYKDFNIFLLQKFLSMNNDLVQSIDYISKYVFFNNMSKEEYYKLLIYLIPKGKYWIEFSKKDKGFVVPEWFLELIKKYFIFISSQDAIEYFNLMNKDDKLALLKLYGIPKEKIKEIE